ncbi:MAG: polyhydroxyalkanoate synthesis repressor PhaR [Cellvibrionales bacterium]|jgi:polyhydroxyalkanoate synthesis repressor PhaR|nr:MAG: polyhydroxyalkanoate synthesis repressor PhaR [Cellvibrionales bacterium]
MTAKKTASPTATSAAKKTRSTKAKPAASAAQAPAYDGVVIKKYPNRRLYDTSSSAYITLVEIKDMVVAHEKFVVLDAKTGEDLTRSILLQIILEEESGGLPLFSAQSLSNLIRFYGQATQSVMGRALEKNFQAMMEMQARMQEQRKVLSPDAWAQMMNPQSGVMQNLMGNYGEQSRSMLAQMQEQMLKAFQLKK